jgi:hypothetical protein
LEVELSLFFEPLRLQGMNMARSLRFLLNTLSIREALSCSSLGLGGISATFSLRFPDAHSSM